MTIPETEGDSWMQYRFELTCFHAPPGELSRWTINAWIRQGSLLVFLIAFVFLPAHLKAEKPKPVDSNDKIFRVALFTGSEKNVPFWDLFADFMREASHDLGIELEVFFANGSRRQMATDIRDYCQRNPKPDAIVVQSFKRNGLNSLQIAKRFEIPVFLVNSGLTAEQQKEIGESGDNFSFWIGEMLPDDYGAGYQLANALIDEARRDPKRLGPDGRVHLIGLNGIVSDGASIQRVAGLTAAVAERSTEAVLDQVIAADWEQPVARLRCRFLHRRYPDASVIWTASDRMAAGAIEALRDRKLTPGKDVIVGGVDASPEAMKLIQEGSLYATIGGHFMDGGWVAVLLYDYLHGVKLANLPPHSASPMTLVTGDNLALYQAALNPSTWQHTDFKKLSQREKAVPGKYQFGLGALATDSSIPATVPSVQGDSAP